MVIPRVAVEVGVVLPSRSLLGLRDLAAVAGGVEQAGVASVYLNESGNDALSAAAFLLGRTQTLSVGTGIANIGTRHPYVAGMAAAELESAAPGRFRLGLGVGSASFNQDAIGQRLDRPIARLAEYVAVARGVACGTLERHDGPLYPVLRVDRHAPAVASVRIDAAALRPRAIERLAPLVDGFIVNYLTPATLTTLIATASGARQSGTPNRFTAYVQLITTGRASRAAAHRTRAQLVARYGAHVHYRRAFALAGFAEEASAIAGLYASGGDPTTAVSAALAETMVAIDDPAPLATALVAAGADSIVIYPTPAEDADWDRSFAATIAAAKRLSRQLVASSSA